MKQLYYVNGKRVDINTYANALNEEIAAEEAQNVFEVKKKGFIEYLNKPPLFSQNGKTVLLHLSQLYRLSLIHGAILMIVNCY